MDSEDGQSVASGATGGSVQQSTEIPTTTVKAVLAALTGMFQTILQYQRERDDYFSNVCGMKQVPNGLNVQWGKKVFSQPPIVHVLPLKKMREACNFHHRYTSTMRDKIRKKIQKITL